jgi:hypothetical protein
MRCLCKIVPFGFAFALLWGAPTASFLQAQETRGCIMGRIVDQSGAVIPGATVDVINKAMGTKASLPTNDQGFYQATYLVPGLYRIEVEFPGFRKFIRDDLDVRSDRLEVNITLEIGQLNEVITVSGETPLLNSTSASLAHVMEGRRITELPLAHGNPYQLIGIAGGVTFNGNPRLDRPYEPTQVVAFSTNGSRANRSDITIDGAPTTATGNANQVTASYVPPVDIIQEFKIQTATFDASFGQTEGGVTNISIKSGTNSLHGTAYYGGLPYNWGLGKTWLPNDFYANRIGQAAAQFKEGRWGGSIGGPVYLPKLYNGRNKTFFMFGYEGIHDSRPRNDAASSTVPSAKMKNGDFSELLALGPQYQIYNPFSATQSGSRIIRQPFTGNTIPQNMINPIGKAILDLYPDPRFPGLADGTNNNYDHNLTEDSKYYNLTFRVDHGISDRHRIFVRGSLYTRNSTYGNYLANPLLTQGAFAFFARSGVIDDVYTINPTTVVNIKYGYNRFIRVDSSDPSQVGYDLTKLGFPASYNSMIPSDIRRFPQIAIYGYQGTDGQAGEWRPVETHSFIGAVQKALGKHFLKTGMEFRAYREIDSFAASNQTGAFLFDSTWTKGPYDNSTASPVSYGQSVAALLLGLPAASSYVRKAASYAEQSTSWGIYFQDDWKFSSKLTFNLGLRWEYEGPLTERFNRSVRNFDTSYQQPIQAAVQAAYAKNPVTEVPQLYVTGGLTFAGVNGEPRTLYTTPKKDFMPRFGFAYRLGNRTVVRGGYGIFFGFLGERRGDVVQSGFQRDTNFVPSTNNGLTFSNTLSNPFPDGILEPVGAGQGYQTFLGQSITFFVQNPQPSYAQRWELSVQRELPSGIVVEVAYVGNRGTHIEINRNLNVTPQKYLSKSPVRDQTTINNLTGLVANPFNGILTSAMGASSTFTSSMIARERLMRPFPEFDAVNATSYDGYSWYHGGQFRFEKRFSRGYSVVANYTWSKFMQATELLNQDDPRPTEVISDYDAPHRFTASAILEFPLGPGHRLLSASGPVLSRLVGGWQITPVYVYQSGAPVAFGNVLYYGDPTTIALPSDQRTPERWFNTDGFEKATTKQLDHNVRTFPFRFSGIRADGGNEVGFSLLKNTKVSEGKYIQFKGEVMNAFNHPVLQQPITYPATSTSFGSTVGANQANYPRRVQLSLKLIF